MHHPYTVHNPYIPSTLPIHPLAANESALLASAEDLVQRKAKLAAKRQAQRDDLDFMPSAKRRTGGGATVMDLDTAGLYKCGADCSTSC